MKNDYTICVGTVGAGVWYSSNGGNNWRRSEMNLPFYAEPGEIQIRALAVSPEETETIYAGSEVGIYRSDDKGATWHLIESPMDGSQIWSIAVHPENPDIILAGTKPSAVYQSQNKGESWELLPLDLADKCFAGAPKITSTGVRKFLNASSLWVPLDISI